MRYLAWALTFGFLSGGLSAGQTLKPRPANPVETTPTPAPESKPDLIPLTVPAGTPIKVALDKEVHIHHAGQFIHAKTVEPVYAFDKLVIPQGSEVTGTISAIGGVAKGRRTLAALNGQFSPPHEIHVDFDTLVLPDGRRLPLRVVVTPSSSAVLRFVPANEKAKTGVKAAGKEAASKEVSALHDQLKKEWETAQQQIHEPGKMHRLERMGVAQLPYHPQYLDAGTAFNADLQQPLDFGQEPVTKELLETVGTPPPPGSLVHAVLVTPLSSATAKKGDLVDAVITQPLVVSDHLLLPEGSHLKGSVLQARSARMLERNGQLRIVFHQVVPPDGIEQKVQASLEGVEVSKGEHLSLDSEGGAQATTPKTRYLTTAISVALATGSFGDHDAGAGGADPGRGAVDGASGFGFVGSIVGALSHSRAVTSAFGVYGASMSVYSHFLARGHDVVYPKDMSMVVGLGTRPAPQALPAAPSPAAESTSGSR